jgi:hypothetical protein
MVPPGKCQYFYSFGGENGVAQAAKDQPAISMLSDKHVRDIKFTELDGETFMPVNFTSNFMLKDINYLISKSQNIMDNFYDPI